MPLKKFENKIKSEIESREIQPSPDSWKRLNQRLNDSAEYRTTKYHWIAASVAAVGLLTLWLTQESPVANSIIVKPAVGENQNIAIIDSSLAKQNIKNDVVNKTENNAVIPIKITQSPQIQVAQVLPYVVGVGSNSENDSHPIELDVRDEFGANQVTSIEEVSKVKSSISDEELDALLNRYRNEVRREITDQKDISQKAKSLLAEVEKEMDQSFKNQIFDALLSGAKAVQTVYINRKN